MDLSTTYLGLPLKNPVMPGASPLVDKLDNVRRLEDAGAAAIVMHSLFEEQITNEQIAEFAHTEYPAESFSEAVSYFPQMEDYIKAIMCGASVVQVVSSLLKYGPSHIGPLITGLSRWLEEHDYKSVEEMRGSMSHLHCPDPSVFERANYLRVLQLWKV